MRIADVIIKKRNGFELTDEEIRFFIKELVDGRIEGSQLGRTYPYIIYPYLSIHRLRILRIHTYVIDNMCSTEITRAV